MQSYIVELIKWYFFMGLRWEHHRVLGVNWIERIFTDFYGFFILKQREMFVSILSDGERLWLVFGLKVRPIFDF
jgi:hypothetical protein